MREKINRLAKGIVDTEIPQLTILPEQIDETVSAGEISRKELYISDAHGLHIKGLAYSTNVRVQVDHSSFGGSRNRITYEVDGTHLDSEDVIEGAFFLVTNGGERKITYRFRVDRSASGRIIGGLKTAADFGELVRKDLDTALRLFEYQDFIDAPFMQDRHTRTLYDGLKGHSNRLNLLEEFLVSLKVKEPVELSCEEGLLNFQVAQEPLREVIQVQSSTWGYTSFDVSADGDFIELPKKSFQTQDFKDGECQVAYVINPVRLHKGKNMGAIFITTIRSAMTVRFEVQGEEQESHQELPVWQRELARYLSLRLEYETGRYEDRLLINQMLQETEKMRKHHEESLLVRLLQAELCLISGQKDRAWSMLEGCRDEASANRLEQMELYCFYMYLCYQIQKKTGQRDTLIRLLGKQLSEKKNQDYLFFLLLKLEPSMKENPGELLDRLRQMFKDGCKSPFLYAEGLKLFIRDISLLKKMDSFELQVMFFAAKRELIEHEMALRIAALAEVTKHYHPLYYRILVKLYEQYEEKKLLEAVCCMLIKGDLRAPEYFHWYQDALVAGISLTRLYEYYLYALPRNYPYLLPKEVLLYFSYQKDLDDETRSLLYMNILRYMKPEAALYQQYERDIEKFTMDQLLQSRINRRLVVLYQRMIYREMIDDKVARVLPAILRSYRVRLKNPNMKYVIARYEELDNEDAFQIRDGVAYVPLFLEHTVLLFQDAYGNRYINIPYRKSPAMEKENTKELEDQCFEIYPNHPMLRLQECEDILHCGVTSEADALTLQRAFAELGLNPLYRKRILSALIAWYQEQVAAEEDADDSYTESPLRFTQGKNTESPLRFAQGKSVDYLLGLDLDELNRKERAGVCETLIQSEYIREAYEIIRQYGSEDIRSSRLLKLSTKMILNRLFDQDETLLQLACYVFAQEKYDGVILDYLCEHFNGSTKQMFKVLNQGIREHVDVYDMPERLLAQMIFTGETDRIDQVFDWYATGKKTSENVVRAYFTLKSADYFLKDRVTDDKVFTWLEGALQGAGDKGRLPTIYLLALTKYYAGQKALTEGQQDLCEGIVTLLLSEGRIFAHFKQLARLIPVPEVLNEQVIVEYKGNRDAKPELQVRILPEEENYHYEEFRRVYPGVFVCPQVLFDGEILEYQVYQVYGEERLLVKADSISRSPVAKEKENSRYRLLNEMGLCLSLKEEVALKDKMKKYLTDSAMMEELFHLM